MLTQFLLFSSTQKLDIKQVRLSGRKQEICRFFCKDSMLSILLLCVMYLHLNSYVKLFSHSVLQFSYIYQSCTTSEYQLCMYSALPFSPGNSSTASLVILRINRSLLIIVYVILR